MLVYHEYIASSLTLNEITFKIQILRLSRLLFVLPQLYILLSHLPELIREFSQSLIIPIQCQYIVLVSVRLK